MRPTSVPDRRKHAPAALGGPAVSLLSCMILLASAAGDTLPAQEPARIMGQVGDATTAEPLSGAQVYLDGTGIGTLTDARGRYILPNVQPGTYTLRVELIGYASDAAEVAVEGGAGISMNFELSQQALSMEEIVVTGTAGQARRREVGNSIASIDAGRLDVKPVDNVSALLQGEVAGLQMFSTEGQVGAGTQIRLRGNNSITQGNEPLIYIDGVRMTSAKNPGAAGSQQKGSPLDNLNPDDIERIEVIRGAAATTLYGTEANSGVVQIFTNQGGGGDAVWSLEAMEGVRFLTGNALGPVVGQHESFVSLKPWLENGMINDLSASVRGSAQGINYYVSGDYSGQEGVMPTQGSTRAGFRTNIGFEPADGLRLNVNTMYSHRVTDWLQSGDNANGVVLNLLRSPRNYTDGRDEQLFDQETMSIDDQFVASLTGTYNPFPSLTTRLTLGLDWIDGLNVFTQPFGIVLFPEGQRDANRWRHTTLTADYVGTWSRDLAGTVNSQFSWGFQVFRDYDHRQFGESIGFAGPGVNQTLSSGALRSSGENILREVNAGFFVQEQIGLNDRFFVTGGLRVDGNSSFGDDFGLQAYPKVSGSYLLSDAAFWPGWWQTLKLRAAVGESGKAPGAFDAVRTYSPVAAYEGKPAVTPQNLGDPNLGPERTREIEFGFEGSALDDRATVDFSWYRARTSEALVPVQFPPSEGFAEPQLTNVGVLENQGIELGLELTPVRRRNLVWDARVQYATNHSEALDLDGAELQIGFQSWRQWVREGYPVPSYFGFKVQNPDEIAEPVMEADQYYGPSYPTHNWSVSTDLNFLQRFTFSALGEGAGGHYLMNGVGRQNHNRELWPECNERNETREQQPAIWRARCTVGAGFELWIMPADYFKLRNVSLTYDFPEGLVPGTSSAALTVAGQNLWKSTEYSGLDPEITRGDRFLEKREYYHLPPTQSVTASLRVTF